MTLNLSSKLGKLLVVRAIPRFLWSSTLKIISMGKSVIRSPELQRVKSETVFYSIKASRASARAIKTTAAIASGYGKSGATKIKTRGLEPAGKYLTTTLPNDASRFGAAAKSDVTGFLKDANLPAKSERLKLAGKALPATLAQDFSAVSSKTRNFVLPKAVSARRRLSQIQLPKAPKFSAKNSLPQLSFKSQPKTNSLALAPAEALPLPPVAAQPIPLPPVQMSSVPALAVPAGTISSEALIKMPMTETQRPINNLIGVSQTLSKAINDFSELPLWMTMPMLFASSFVLGAIVSFLIK